MCVFVVDSECSIHTSFFNMWMVLLCVCLPKMLRAAVLISNRTFSSHITHVRICTIEHTTCEVDRDHVRAP